MKVVDWLLDLALGLGVWLFGERCNRCFKRATCLLFDRWCLSCWLKKQSDVGLQGEFIEAHNAEIEFSNGRMSEEEYGKRVTKSKWKPRKAK